MHGFTTACQKLWFHKTNHTILRYVIFNTDSPCPRNCYINFLTLFVFHCIIVFATPIISLNPLQISSYCYQFSFVKRTKRKIKDQFPVNNALHSDHTLSLWFIVFVHCKPLAIEFFCSFLCKNFSVKGPIFQSVYNGYLWNIAYLLNSAW